MNAMNTGMEMDEEMIAVSPIYKSAPGNKLQSNNDGSLLDANNSPPSVLGNTPPPVARRPSLHYQHSYAGHEDVMTSNNTVGFVPRAPSGRPFLATRHLSMEEHRNRNNDNDHANMPNNTSRSSQWSHHPAIRNQNHQRPQSLFHSPVEENQGRQQPSPPPPEQRQEETAEERARREDEESIALAQMLMAEEAMASHRMSADFLRMNSEHFSQEDFAALQDALNEEEDVEYDETEGEEVDEDMSYDALLRLGERIGDVKTDRWTMIAHKEIAKLETFQYDPSAHTKEDGEDANMEDIDDSELKCLVCQFTYEKGDALRRLPCGHCFHKDCVDQWLQTKDCCAYCRQCILPDKDEKKQAEAQK